MMNGAKLTRSFTWLNITQFLGALNDNVFKLLVVFLLAEVLGTDNLTGVVAMSSFVFMAPFLLFSHAGGVLADRFSKRHVIVAMKVLEVAVMALGLVAAMLRLPWLLYSVIFLMSTQSALFGPSKYGIIPELVGPDRLSRANAFLVGLTYLAIIVGTFVPSFLLIHVLGGSFTRLAVVCIGVAVAGFAASTRIEMTPAQRSAKKYSPWFLGDIARTLRGISGDRHLAMAVFGSAYFMFLAAFVQQNTLLYGQEVLHIEWVQSGYIFPVAAVGIALGAILAGRVSGRNIEFGVVPIGAVSLAAASGMLGAVSPGIVGTAVFVLLMGIGAGLFIVPLDAFIQYRSPAGRRGEILACASFLSFAGAALSAGVLLLLANVGLDASGRFIAVAILTIALAAVAIGVLPDFLVRFAVVVVTRLIYRIRVSGLVNLPVEGPALLVPNHVTWADALILSAVQQRRIRFVMAREVYENRWLQPLFRLMGVIPVAPNDTPRRIVESLKLARRALDEGFMVCIFAEGALTRNGNMQSFKPGLTHILRGLDCPVVPIHIGWAWGSVFSYRSGKMPSWSSLRIPYQVCVHIGSPMPSSSSPFEIRQAVLALSQASFDLKRGPGRTLAHAFVATARRRWFSLALWDTTGKSLSFGRALTAAVLVGDRLGAATAGEEAVGIMLPSSVAGAVTNMALTLRGQTPVNLNFTVSPAALEKAVNKAGIRTIVTSRAFMQKLGRSDVPARTVYAEDMFSGIGRIEGLSAALRALAFPVGRLMRFRTAGPNDVATIIFSSGSTGDPKGISLSHHNILSNLESFSMVLRFGPDDRMCSVLPFFHSFGFTCTLWCPVVEGFATFYHPNPLDSAKVLEMLREQRLTILLGTPSFLSSYARRGSRADVASLRLAVAGAEKLRAKMADDFEACFGIRPLEGYGTTETAPVVSVNVPDVEAGGVRQVGAKDGSIGHPIPGVAAKVVDLDTWEPLAPGKPGMLLVKGPNVMLGYLHEPARTREVMSDGWYVTGDIASIDEDGFVFIRDRISRFSKIGGEMVPHMAVEDEIARNCSLQAGSLVVTAVPDDRKGEQLVVLFTPDAGDAETLFNSLRDSSLPNLWKPRLDHFIMVETLPMLGSGKLDLRRIRELAAGRLGAGSIPAPGQQEGGT